MNRTRRSAGALVAAAGLLASACTLSVGGAPVAGTRTASSATISTAPTPAMSSGLTESSSGPTESRPPAPTAASGRGSAPPASPAPAAGPPNGPPVIGAPGIGDRYYPMAGNGGYQVRSYDVALTYVPATNSLRARTDIVAIVTAPGALVRFDLDLQPSMGVSRVEIDGRAEPFRHTGAELVISPARGLPHGHTMKISVTYAGAPGLISGLGGGGTGGWVRTRGGGAVVAGEPFSASAWYPVNEHPADPAEFTVTATVPAGWRVISNGVAQRAPTGRTGWVSSRWKQSEPIASYLTTIYIDRFAAVIGKLPDGKPIVSALAPGAGQAKDNELAAQTARVIAVLSRHFGHYPFDAVGGIYLGQHLPFALETATRPVYADWVDLDTVVHELSHQWFGDEVPIRRWADICLSECFASYGPWLWHQDVDHVNLDTVWSKQMTQVAGMPKFWSSPLVDMGPGREFTSVYSRGPLALHALRKLIGEKAFATILATWPSMHPGRPMSFDDWARYVDRVSGQHLGPFIDAWFRGRVVPPEPFRHPGDLGR